MKTTSLPTSLILRIGFLFAVDAFVVGLRGSIWSMHNVLADVTWCTSICGLLKIGPHKPQHYSPANTG